MIFSKLFSKVVGISNEGNKVKNPLDKANYDHRSIANGKPCNVIPNISLQQRNALY